MHAFKLKNHLFLLFSILFLTVLSACKINNPEKYYSKAQEEFAPFDAIIVPGVPFKDSSWQNVMKLRVYWAKYLWDNGMTKNIIFSGGAVYTKYSECKIMKLYAVEMGILEENIFLDSLAEHSTENVYYSFYVAKDKNFEKIALASDPYQTKGLKPFVKKLNKKLDTNIQLLPAVMDSVLAKPMPDYAIDYESAVGSYFVNITETQSFWYRFKGTLGLHIDWENRP